MTGKQQTVGWLALGLIVANVLDGGLRDALGSLTHRANGGGGGPKLPGQGFAGGGPFQGNPFMPHIPGVPQGPLSGIPFSPISSTGGTNLHGLPPLPPHAAATLSA